MGFTPLSIGFTFWQQEQSSVPAAPAYVTEDSAQDYVIEDGSQHYVPES